MRLDFLGAARNVVFVAPQGLGKTMLAQNIAHEAVLHGHSVIFTTAAQLLLDLAAQESARSLERRLRHYAKTSLLVLDEIGYLAFDNRNADLLFQVVTRRYERKSLVMTTTHAFKDWPTIFPNATCATALIDRVIHHADVIAIKGKSYVSLRADPPGAPSIWTARLASKVGKASGRWNRGEPAVPRRLQDQPA